MKRKVILVLTVTLLLSQTACSTGKKSDDTSETRSATQTEAAAVACICKPFDDLRPEDDSQRILQEGEYKPEHIYTYTFNDEVILKGSEDVQEELIEKGKNPGIGIRALQEKGYTGKGVNVAIIDQNLLLDHPEFKDKIAAYYDTGCEMPEDNGSMHGPAVTSILVGKDIGVAPDAKLYYAAVPTWKADSSYYAKALDWVVEQNAQLPADQKIRVISISADPSYSDMFANTQAYKEALQRTRDAGIMVLDCSEEGYDGVSIAPAYCDPENKEDFTKCRGGFPNEPYQLSSNVIGAPCNYRTVAEEYVTGKATYRYEGVGGLSWGIPLVAGTLAMGWQVDPSLSNDQAMKILVDTCARAGDGSKIVNPTAFVEAVEKNKQ